MDIHGFARRWERELQLIATTDKLTPLDKEKLTAFGKETARRISKAATLRYCLCIRQVAGWLGKPLTTATLDDFDDVVRRLEQEEICRKDGRPHSKTGIRDYKLAVKVYWAWLGRTADAAQIRTTPPKRLLDPSTLWTEPELNRLIMAAGNVQDQALVAVLVESAGRIGEIGDMRITDVKFDLPNLQSDEALIHIDGKTGPRSVPLIWSTPYIRRWLEQHPYRGKPDGPLWVYNDGRQRMYPSLANAFRKAKNTCGIAKRCNPHLFRKSTTTILRRKGYDPELVKRRNGWTRNSTMLSVYESVTDDDVLNESRKVNGTRKLEVAPTRVRSCQFCGMVNAPAAKNCGGCGEVLDMAERERLLTKGIMQQFAGQLAPLTELLDKLLTAKQVKELNAIEDKNVAVNNVIERIRGELIGQDRRVNG